MIYFDNSATTKPYSEALDTYSKVSEKYFGNPSSLHRLGLEAEQILTKSREAVASLFQVDPKEIIFTSGGTEGNNLAIKGIALEHINRGKHIITSTIEHASVYETFQSLEKLGYDITYLPVHNNGLVSPEQVKAAIRQDTILVSLIHVNNETGAIQPIEAIGAVIKQYPKVFFHVDHVQGVTKVPLSIKEAGVDLLSVSGHKFHAPNGTGVLYVRKGVALSPLFTGGVQEGKLRAGTENIAGAAALAKALRLSLEKSVEGVSSLKNLKDIVVQRLTAIKGVHINHSEDNSAPHIVNFSVPGIKPEVLIQSLSEKEIYVSTKSACSSKLASPSRVLLEMGLSQEIAESGIRVSFSFENTEEEVNVFITELEKIIPELLEVMR